MPFVVCHRDLSGTAASTASAAAKSKWEPVRANDNFVLERRQRPLRSMLYRIRLVVCGNSLVLFEGDSKSDALREFDDLNNPRSVVKDSSTASTTSRLDVFWSEAMASDDVVVAESNVATLENIFSVSNRSRKRATIERAKRCLLNKSRSPVV